jgi:hypothetical protein
MAHTSRVINIMSKSPHVTSNAAEQMRSSTASNALSWQEHQDRIEACHTVTDPWAMGTLCAEAFLQLKDDDLKVLRKNLPFGAGNFQKYSAVGRASWLYSPKFKGKLPQEFSLLYLREVLFFTDAADYRDKLAYVRVEKNFDEVNRRLMIEADRVKSESVEGFISRVRSV